jgi:hypothetical protein
VDLDIAKDESRQIAAEICTNAVPELRHHIRHNQEDTKMIRNKIRIPKSLHELFGEEQNKSELIITFLFIGISFLALILVTRQEWADLRWYKTILLFLLLLDILGGVAANLSQGTNRYYRANQAKQRIFIAVHIQPLLFAWIIPSDFRAALLVWLYTIGSTILLHLLRHKEYQLITAGALFGLGILALLLPDFQLPRLLTLIYLLYMFKLIIGFSVDHSSETTM